MEVELSSLLFEPQNAALTERDTVPHHLRIQALCSILHAYVRPRDKVF